MSFEARSFNVRASTEREKERERVREKEFSRFQDVKILILSN